LFLSLFLSLFISSQLLLVPYQNIVNGDMNQLDKEADEAHDKEPNPHCLANLHEFLAVRFGALFDQMHGIASKFLQWLKEDFLETFLFGRHGDDDGVVDIMCSGKSGGIGKESLMKQQQEGDVRGK
jgi:hypothetical protein